MLLQMHISLSFHKIILYFFEKQPPQWGLTYDIGAFVFFFLQLLCCKQ